MTCDPVRGRGGVAGGPPIRRLWRDLLFPQMHEIDDIFLFLFSLLFDILHDIRKFLICAVFIFLGCVFALILAMREGNNKLCHEVVVVWVCFLFVGFFFPQALGCASVPFLSTWWRSAFAGRPTRKKKKTHDKQTWVLLLKNVPFNLNLRAYEDK